MLQKTMFSRARISPFRGLLYNKEIVGDIAKCVCPPYDVTEDPKKYYDKSPYNAIRVELPLDSPQKDKYESAKETLELWLKEKVLYEDSEETFYILEQTFPFNGKMYKRSGFFTLLRLDINMILTHEKTRMEPKEDRKRLLQATRTFSSLVFGLYVDKEGEIENVLERSDRELLYDFVDEGEIGVKLFRMENGDQIERLVKLMEDKRVYIADGHHRLEVAKDLGFSYIPIYLTNMLGNGIKILPYHRLIKFENREKGSRTWHKLSEGVKHGSVIASSENLFIVKEKLLNDRNLSFGVLRREDPQNIYVFELGRDLDNISNESPLDKLKIKVIHDHVIRALLEIEEREIDFTPYFEKALDGIKKGIYDMAFLCPPVSIGEVKEIAEAKLNMPPKSTYFFPKIPTGPIFYRHG